MGDILNDYDAIYLMILDLRLQRQILDLNIYRNQSIGAKEKHKMHRIDNIMVCLFSMLAPVQCAQGAHRGGTSLQCSPWHSAIEQDVWRDILHRGILLSDTVTRHYMISMLPLHIQYKIQCHAVQSGATVKYILPCLECYFQSAKQRTQPNYNQPYIAMFQTSRSWMKSFFIC